MEQEVVEEEEEEEDDEDIETRRRKRKEVKEKLYGVSILPTPRLVVMSRYSSPGVVRLSITAPEQTAWLAHWS